MSITDLVAALAERYGDTVDNDNISSYLAEQGYDVSTLSPEDLDDITSQVLELILAEQSADADAAKNPLSLDKVDAMADADAAQRMANEDNTTVVEKSVDKDNDGDIDQVLIKKKTTKKSKESEDDNSQESEDDPHEAKLNSNLIDAIDRRY